MKGFKVNSTFFFFLLTPLQETQNLISILHLFAMNHPIDDSNVMKFLETYFQGLFKTTLFSLVCLKGNEKSKFAKTLNQINKQFLTDVPDMPQYLDQPFNIRAQRK